MEYLLVFLAALLVGAIVYWMTLRQEGRGPAAPADEGDWDTTAEEAPPAPVSTSSTVYVPLLPASRTWETRVTGIVGIVVLVTLSAATLAFVLYLGGSFVVDLFGDAATNGGLNGGVPPAP
jgi:hypothetical protein